MQEVLLLIGSKGIIFGIGLTAFMLCYKYSVHLFQWIEDQTYGTRDYVLQKLEFLQKEIKEEHITYALLFLSFGFSFIIMAVCSMFGKYLAGGILAVLSFIIGWKIPRPFMDYLVEKRIKAYQGQMVDGLNLLSNGLRAGLSVPQSLAMIVDELPAPISEEFNLILQQNKIGSPLEECFIELAKRVPTEDNDMFVTSVNILRETGGNLAETFDTIAFVIRERVRLQQKIDTYTAQGMMQGGTIFCMPFAMGTIYFISDPDSMMPLFTTPLGIIMIIVALGFNLAGGFAILKVVKIKI